MVLGSAPLTSIKDIIRPEDMGGDPSVMEDDMLKRDNLAD